MSIPLMTLVAFALWTQLTLLGTIGIYRWSHILTGRADFQRFGTPDTTGETDLYKRSMRAHANCVENLPIYAVVVFAAALTGVETPLLGVLACIVIGARVCHTLVHVAFEQSNRVLVVRFTFFFIQFVLMAWMGVHVLVRGLG